MAKKLTFSQPKVNFLAITFQSVNRLISNFEYGKIWRIHGLFAKAVCRNKVVNLGEKWLTWAIIYCIWKFNSVYKIFLIVVGFHRNGAPFLSFFYYKSPSMKMSLNRNYQIKDGASVSQDTYHLNILLAQNKREPCQWKSLVWQLQSRWKYSRTWF